MTKSYTPKPDVRPLDEVAEFKSLVSPNNPSYVGKNTSISSSFHDCRVLGAAIKNPRGIMSAGLHHHLYQEQEEVVLQYKKKCFHDWSPAVTVFLKDEDGTCRSSWLAPENITGAPLLLSMFYIVLRVRCC